MTQGLPPLPDLGSGLEVGERLPGGGESIEDFRRWLISIGKTREAEQLTPDTFRDHNLYLFFKASTTPFVPGVGATRPLAPPEFPTTPPPPSDPFAAPGILTPSEAARGVAGAPPLVPPPTEDAPGAELSRDEIIRQLEKTGMTMPEYIAARREGRDPFAPAVQEEHLGFKGFWGNDGYFYTWDEFEGKNRRVDFDASRVVEPEAAAPPGETESQRLTRERREEEFETTEARLKEEFRLTREFQEESRRLEQERFQLQLTGEREERLAQLAAQPISWLQHAALSGQQPVVQPWMMPLMRPGQNLQVGQPIPGFQAGAPGAQQGGFIPGTATPQPLGTQFANLPELRRPSAQLFARMGPTAQQQWLGLRQARTGIPPQETLFRQTQGGPPGAGRGGFQQQRLRV